MAVQDPNFWRRFSVAVHQDEASKNIEAQPQVNHAYVFTTSSRTSTASLSFPAPIGTSTRTSYAAQPAAVQHARRRSSTTTTATPPSSPPSTHPSSHKSLPRIQTISFATTPLKSPSSPSAPPSPLTPHLAYPAPSFPPPSPRTRFSGFTRSGNNGSTWSLGVGGIYTGRPRSQFRVCTTITANADARISNRRHTEESWLDRTKRKQRQRVWICWAFWLILAAVVAGVVVAVLLLKAKGVI